ncbi:MAG: hypothetical protein EXR99_12485 [Gemmataceae bacterium]|nr:hypothetical protein [Gemmataceae bacterium]
MGHHDKKHNEPIQQTGSKIPREGLGNQQAQADFEVDFFQKIIELNPQYVDVLRVLGNLLTLKGKYAEGMAIDKRLVRLRPSDALAHYNLACSYALLSRTELSLKTLRLAIDLGYSDFHYMREDKDLDSIRHDPRFKKIIKAYENGA